MTHEKAVVGSFPDCPNAENPSVRPVNAISIVIHFEGYWLHGFSRRLTSSASGSVVVVYTFVDALVNLLIYVIVSWIMRKIELGNIRIGM